MKKILLWLDDARDPFNKKEDWLRWSPIGRDVHVKWVKSYEAFCHWIMVNGLPDAICFDHDLGFCNDWYIDNDIESPDPDFTGYDCAKWLCKYCDVHSVTLPIYAIQSANPVGAENIKCYLENYKKCVE